MPREILIASVESRGLGFGMPDAVPPFSAMQIAAVESRGDGMGIFVVRCVNGTVRERQVFGVASAATVTVSVDWIDRYGRRVDVFDAPHVAMVQLSGDAVGALERGSILAASPPHG
ncbi:hypothetical protein H9Y04_06065 [Streptomyces sp. TRM66268-LWL]|uniref:Uncharacterized protein n=1 Tax=Streptomyces polyasparticus TaxID=2767826 RepID=A0ABR7SB79_9ACTN|nr:hypothetical protein [Streptomyces polyasparticus]MBC9712134.1 hypothetical protein [Streptomyces polyasparticus]